MQTYELLYLTPLQQGDVPRAVIGERIAKVLQEAGGSIVATREFARQRLSYPITHHQAGEYLLVEFTAPGAAVQTIGRELRLLPDILRIMVTRKLEKARPIGAEIAARERAQEQASAQVTTAPPVIAGAPMEEPKAIENLDEKLEEILGKEIV